MACLKRLGNRVCRKSKFVAILGEWGCPRFIIPAFFRDILNIESGFNQTSHPRSKCRSLLQMRGVSWREKTHIGSSYESVAMNTEKTIQPLAPESPLRGWHILSPAYQKPSLIDGLSFEWDYLMIHDHEGRFTGIIGYFLSDPRNRLKGLFLPAGGSVAIAGEFNTNERVAEFTSFDCQHMIASEERREFNGTDPATGSYATLEPIPASGDQPDTLRLQGRTTTFEWDLSVTQEWS